MGVEIERKFLVVDDGWRAQAGPGAPMLQGYLCAGPPVAVRVRSTGGKAYVNLKKATLDIARLEFEYEIPSEDAAEILGHLCQGHIIQKVRYRVEYAGRVWEVDVFAGANSGLVVAEVEIEAPDAPVELPPWVGEEVSGDPRYLNTHLSLHPYSEW